MQELNKRRIGILTSGGDSPGMNNVINAVYKTFRGINHENSKIATADKRPFELVLIKNGYKGIMTNDIHVIDNNWANLIDLGTEMGGTIIGSARFREFEQEETRKKCIEILKSKKIEGLIAIGGDGTYNGLQKLSNEAAIQCVGIPGTIDNDISSSEFTIGFDTALNTIVENLDKIRQTANSHGRIMIVEVMGRNCGDLALHSAAAANCDLVATKDLGIGEQSLIDIIKQLYTKKQRRSLVIVVTEHQYDVNKIAKIIEKDTDCETRAVILGQIQRGGTPSAFDRYLATMMGIFAAERFANSNKSSICIGLQDNKLVTIEIQDTLNTPSINKNNVANKILRLSGVIFKKNT